MRKTERYTIPFPVIPPPPRSVYEEAFARFPFWYRWYLRVRSVITTSTIEATTRRHHLQELRRRLAISARAAVDPGIPALLPGFHHHIREIIVQRDAIAPSLDEATGSARGRFLKVILADRNPGIDGRLQRESQLTENELDNPEMGLEEVRESVRVRMEQILLQEQTRISRELEAIWLALRSLNLLTRLDLGILLPVQQARREETPLRVVADNLVQFFQVIELCHQHHSPDATEAALNFARSRIRSARRSPRAIWIAIEELRAAIPMLDIIKYAKGEPFLAVPPMVLNTDWWSPFCRAWIENALDRSAGELLEYRHRTVLSLLRNTFMIEVPPPVWIPTTLQPRTLGVLLLLAGGDLFQDTRRVITQLVIDATFFHLDTRNTLHQMALQLDQALERLTALLGSMDTRGTMGEEVQRLQQRSGPSSIMYRQLTTVYERHRPKLRSAIDESIEALTTAGGIISRNLDGKEQAFEIREFQNRTFTSDLPPTELLTLVGAHWQSLGRMIQGLFRLESTSPQRGGGR